MRLASPPWLLQNDLLKVNIPPDLPVLPDSVPGGWSDQ